MSDPAPPSKGEIEWERIKAILNKWLDECDEIRDKMIEALLANLDGTKD